MHTCIIVALSALVLALAPVESGRAQAHQKVDADAAFLSQVIPGIASSGTIIEYAQQHASDAQVRDFAQRVAKQHQESVTTASEHAKRLNVAVVADPDKASKDTIDAWSTRKGADVAVAVLQWLSHMPHDTTVVDTEVKNGADAEVSTSAHDSITAGNEHGQEAGALLDTMKP